MRPFLKWAGGKFRLVNRIGARLPQGQRLVEPFVGSGAVWLNADFPQALLADVNPDLIQLYSTLKAHGDDFIAYCRTFFTPENNTPDRYYALRDRFNDTGDAWEKSALFLYLNRHGFNGLCRYNSAGTFNVPFGRYRRPYFPADEMRFFQAKSAHAEFLCADFRTVMQNLELGDVVYCDPPYVPLSDTANFTDYARGGFGPEEQRLLAVLAEDAARRGIPVLISNHATGFTRAAYGSAEVESFAVQRFISADGAHRGAVQELLALFVPDNFPQEESNG